MAISSEDFRSTLRHFPAGVTIVTIKAAGEVHGLTVSAFASVSPDPPLIAVFIDRRHKAQRLLEQADAVFAVSILAQDQMEISNRFAWVKDEDRFARGAWTTAVTGAPVLENALAWLDCTIDRRLDAGTHTMVMGLVQAASQPRAGERPLVYWNRGYRSLGLGEPTEE